MARFAKLHRTPLSGHELHRTLLSGHALNHSLNLCFSVHPLHACQVVDLKRFTPWAELQEGLLTVLELLPGA